MHQTRTLMSRYLDVGDKVEETLESLKGQMSLWKELVSAEEELEDWVNTSISDLNASVSSLEDSAGLQSKIKEVHSEIEKLVLSLWQLTIATFFAASAFSW